MIGFGSGWSLPFQLAYSAQHPPPPLPRQVSSWSGKSSRLRNVVSSVVASSKRQAVSTLKCAVWSGRGSCTTPHNDIAPHLISSLPHHITSHLSTTASHHILSHKVNTHRFPIPPYPTPACHVPGPHRTLSPTRSATWKLFICAASGRCTETMKT